MKEKKLKADDTSVNLRVSHSLKDEIVRMAGERNQTTSRYLRDLLEEIHLGTYRESIQDAENRRRMLYSRDFTRLIAWLVFKTYDSTITESEEEQRGHVATLKRLGGHLPTDIIVEFDKVLSELLALLGGRETHMAYRFAKSYSDNQRFDYQKVLSFVLSEDFSGSFEGNTIQT